ncbi:MAG: four helix bundle protein [Candidatus Cloacimonetes bacterium]|nr:four helix bundle protein [Candidatus Cloacimonadota bacterium]MCF7813333.1 four helix bundle protein [Candidatus Cloacimonadota bacterium]MCF7867822.1 four helix bundle protein [Candidatus Cloacimonadota bacterium]MCF7883292.1 four helix bundle protein [Candidatus Cloacimonadota bacterium]
MEKSNVILEKSYSFSLKIIGIYKEFYEEYKFRDLLRQLLRCGTSIGANVEEAVGGQSRKDFYAKLCIAYKEALETNYWLRLLRNSNIIPQSKSDELLTNRMEIRKIIGAITKTIKEASK